MDAREYLAKKGLTDDRDESHPNTLEELAWSRARQSGQQRPRSGTPHDWEDWDRYHAELSQGAESVGQKLDTSRLVYQGRMARLPQGTSPLGGPNGRSGG